jgi:hypothetical protein
MNKIKFTKRGRNKAINVLLILSLAASFLIPFNVKADDTSLMIKHFTINCYGIFDTTPQTFASLYDMTKADWSAYVSGKIAQVKTLKPSFKALIYWNMRSVQDVSWMSEVWTACVNNGWFLLDSSRNRILTDVGYLVDFGNPAYQAWIANYLKALMNSVSYDGIYGDNNLAWGTEEYFWGCSATPINPRTNHAWTDAEVRQAVINYHVAVKNAIGSKVLCCNGIWSGYRFYDHQSAYQEILSASPLDGFMSESLWHPYVGSSSVIWMSETQWQQAVNFLILVQNNWLSGHSNRFYVPVAKLAYGDNTHTPLPSGCTRAQMAKYAYASTLLGAETGQATQIYFSTFADSAFELQMEQFYDAQIGAPTNDYYMVSRTHLYARDFSNGKVLVNPTSTNYAITLPSNTYWTYDGTPVTTLTVQAHTGTILLKRDGTSSTYSATINAYCNTERAYVVRPITKDGSPTGYSTPYTFTGLTGTHTFTVPSTDAMGHPFKQWSTGSTSTTITVSSAGTYTAYYQASAAPSIEIWTNKATYAHGETMYVYLQGTNPGSAIYIKLPAKIGLPGGGTYGLWTIYTGTVPASYYGPATFWKSFTVPYSTPVGTYTWIAEIRNPTTNALIDSDTWTWTVT